MNYPTGDMENADLHLCGGTESTGKDNFLQPSTTSVMEENAETTIIELQGTGKITLLLAPGQVADHDADSGKTVMIDNSSFTQIALTVPGRVKAEIIKCEGDYKMRIPLSDQQKSPSPVFDLNRKSRANRETKGPQFRRPQRRSSSAHLFVSGQSQAPKDELPCKDDIETQSIEENVESLTSDIYSIDVRTNKDNVEKMCTDDDVDGQISCNIKHKKRRRHRASKRPLSVDRRVNISKGIQKNFTSLLNQIRLMPLCDYLYQNCIIDMDFYETLFDGKRHGMSTQDSIRNLLLYLSRTVVNEEELRKSLEGSGHSDIVSLLLEA